MIQVIEILIVSTCLIPLIYFYSVIFVNGYYDLYRLYLSIKTNIKKYLLIYISKISLLILSIAFTIALGYVYGLIFAILNTVLSLLIIPKSFIKVTRRFLFQNLISDFIVTCLTVLSLTIKSEIGYVFLVPEVLIVSSVILSYYVNYPIEEIIRTYYLKKARNKIKQANNLKIIGITGSYGKTTVKNFLAEFLSNKCVLVSPGNVNTSMGLTKFINNCLTPFDEYLVVEIGVDKLNGMKKYKRLLNLDYAVITSVGPQHLLTLKSIENVYKVKTDIAYLLKKDGTLFYNSDSVSYSKKFNGLKTVSFSSNDYKIISKNGEPAIVNFDDISIKTRLHFDSSVLNAYCAYEIAKTIGVNKKTLIPKFERLEEISRRKKIIKKGNKIWIDDSYNINFNSAKESIDYALKLQGKKCCITAGLVELGKDKKVYLTKFGEILAKLDSIFIMNNDFSGDMLNGYLSNGGNIKNVIKESKFDKVLNMCSNFDVILVLPIGDKYNLI